MRYSLIMAFADEVKTGVANVLSPTWARRDGTVVPETEDIVLRDGAVDIDATYLYADLADSSALAQKLHDWAAAKIIRSYLNAAVRILRHYNGAIRSFDGDRVMAIFIGNSKNTDAVRAALALNWAMDEVLKPALLAKWPTLKDSWVPNHGIGVDTGKAMLVRGGVRDNNDVVSIGAAPNVAAKLSEIRSSPDIYITKGVYDVMDSKNKTSKNDESMWRTHGQVAVGGKSYTIYSSTWRWSP